MRSARLSSARSASGARKISSGGRIGRSTSCRRCSQRSLVCAQNAAAESATPSPTTTSVLSPRCSNSEAVRSKNKRQVVLDAGRRAAFLQVLVQRAAARIEIEALAQFFAHAPGAGKVQRKLARRQQLHRIHRMVGALGFRIEAAQGIDHVVEQFDAIGNVRAHRDTGRAGRRARRSRPGRAPAARCGSRMLPAGASRHPGRASGPCAGPARCWRSSSAAAAAASARTPAPPARRG